MSYTPTPVEQAAWRVVSAMAPVGTTVIYANQDAPRPTAGSYLTLLVEGDEATGVTYQLTDAPRPGDTFLQRTAQQREIAIFLQSIGPSSYAIMRRVLAMIDTPQIAQLGYDERLSIVGADVMARVPDALATETEDRWSLTLTARYVDVLELNAPAVQEVVGTLHLDGQEAGTVDVTG